MTRNKMAQPGTARHEEDRKERAVGHSLSAVCVTSGTAISRNRCKNAAHSNRIHASHCSAHLIAAGEARGCDR
jgi:hypothetical protein